MSQPGERVSLRTPPERRQNRPGRTGARETAPNPTCGPFPLLAEYVISPMPRSRSCRMLPNDRPFPHIPVGGTVPQAGSCVGQEEEPWRSTSY